MNTEHAKIAQDFRAMDRERSRYISSGVYDLMVRAADAIESVDTTNVEWWIEHLYDLAPADLAHLITEAQLVLDDATATVARDWVPENEGGPEYEAGK